MSRAALLFLPVAVVVNAAALFRDEGGLLLLLRVDDRGLLVRPQPDVVVRLGARRIIAAVVISAVSRPPLLAFALRT